MERRPLGGSDLEITPVGVGTAPIGSVPGHWWVNWGRQDERDSLAAIHAALDGGVNWIDTAPFYGWGRAEEVVGKALRGRDDVLIFTKCGTLRRDNGEDYMDLRPETVRSEVEASLRRLRRDHVDLLQPHDVDRAVPIEETWGAIHELIAEGRVRHAGLSNHPLELVDRALTVGAVASLQFEYSALQRSEEARLLPFALERGLGVIVWAPLASGFLTDGFDLEALEEDDFRRTHPFAQLADLAEVRREIGGTAGALRFVLRHPAVTGAIVGVRNGREAREIVRSASFPRVERSWADHRSPLDYCHSNREECGGVNNRARRRKHMAVFAQDRPVTLVEGVPAADPAPLGLAAFALTTFLLSGHNASFIPDAVWVGPALFYGGLSQLLAGMWEFRNRNVFGATAFSTYGGFWMGLGIIVVLADVSKGFAAGLAGANLTNGLAWFLLAFAIFNTYMLLHSMRVSTAVFFVFLTLEITEILLVIGFFNLSHGGTSWWLHAGGWAGIVTAAVAWYTSAAGVVNGMSPVPVMPVGAAPIGRVGSPMPRRAEA